MLLYLLGTAFRGSGCASSDSGFRCRAADGLLQQGVLACEASLKPFPDNWQTLWIDLRWADLLTNQRSGQFVERVDVGLVEIEAERVSPLNGEGIGCV
jgi:hypothetical protein